jgi:hypothetical protein
MSLLRPLGSPFSPECSQMTDAGTGRIETSLNSADLGATLSAPTVQSGSQSCAVGTFVPSAPAPASQTALPVHRMSW